MDRATKAKTIASSEAGEGWDVVETSNAGKVIIASDVLELARGRWGNGEARSQTTMAKGGR